MLGRLKFPIDDLVSSILDRVPKGYYMSESTTFLDPAMGGGQFVNGIVAKLRDAGHGDDNIRSRVFGYEDNNMRVNYAVEKNKLSGMGTFEARDFLNGENGPVLKGAKFDVVVGNPPFQPINDGDRGLWAKFIRAGNDALTPGGVMAMIVPHGWKSPTADIRKGGVSVFKDIFMKHNITYLNIDPGLGTRHFPGIGQTFTWFVMQKDAYKGSTEIDLGNKLIDMDVTGMKMLPRRVTTESLSIVKKMTSFDETWNFKFRKSIQTSIDWKDTSFIEKRSHPFARINGNSNHLSQDIYTREKCPLHESKKVFLPREGSKFRFVVDNGRKGITNGYYIYFKGPSNAAKTYFNSKLVRWLGTNKYTQYNEGALMNCVGAMLFNGRLTEKDIFDYYRLSRGEIKYVEDVLNGT